MKKKDDSPFAGYPDGKMNDEAAMDASNPTHILTKRQHLRQTMKEKRPEASPGIKNAHRASNGIWRPHVSPCLS